MKMGDLHSRLLYHICCMPYISVGELRNLLGIQEREAYRCMEYLHEVGMVRYDVYGSETHEPERRWSPTVQAMDAAHRYRNRLFPDNQGNVQDLLEDSAASTQTLRIMGRRIETLASVYKLAAVVMTVMGDKHGVDVRLFRSGPYDALIECYEDDIEMEVVARVGIVRMSRARHRSSFTVILDNVLQGTPSDATRNDDGAWGSIPHPDVTVVLVPTLFERQTLATYIADRKRDAWGSARRDGGRVLTGVETTALLSNPDHQGLLRALSTGGTGAVSLASVMREKGISGGDESGEGGGWKRSSPPPARGVRAEGAGLSPGSQRVFDAITDYPLILRTDLEKMFAVGRPRMSQLLGPLLKGGLISREGEKDKTRYSLGEKGLKRLARGGRLSLHDLRSELGPESGFLRQLRRERGHTDALYGIVARARADTGKSRDYELSYLRPERLSKIHFTPPNMRGTLSLSPDAAGCLSYRDEGEDYFVPFYLEYERRAANPQKIRERLSSYQRFYREYPFSQMSFFAQPVLFVVPTERIEQRYLEAIARHFEWMPVCVSNLEILSEEGFLGDIWMRGFCHRTIKYKKPKPEQAAEILPLQERISIADLGAYDWTEYYYGVVDACECEPYRCRCLGDANTSAIIRYPLEHSWTA